MVMSILIDTPRATLLFALNSCMVGVEFDTVFGRLTFHLGPLILSIRTPFGMSEEEMNKLEILDEADGKEEK